MLAGIACQPASAHEQLLRCATSPATARPGHRVQHFAERPFYAPVLNAMFFSHPDTLCRWKAPARYHG
ncbi:hypothetical protein [Lichenicoccus roseus]|uniref:Uncharacterized protein n=1 Tax=Lichenicoccus roseus TaxID=2683649 RepID=A0A5R9J3K5_9PROT|nr:hypothetical protein [Lichenicoccus roseus]TLU72204.1 hypothetical protein FE263_13930 [Lichenicoccus roseus]